MKIREGTLDDFVVKEQTGYKTLFRRGVLPNAVLDIGANIGAFSAHYAKMYPTTQFVGFEPEKDNFDLAVENTSSMDNVKMVKAAVSNKVGEITLYVNGKKNKGTHSVIPTRGRDTEVKIPTVSFSDLLLLHRPEILKIDIEGGEFFILDELHNLPDFVKSIAIELHLTKREYKQAAWDLHASLKKQFPLITKDPKLDVKDVNTYGAWAVVFIGHRA